MTRLSKLVRSATVLLALGFLGLLAYLFARRAFYPYDLEWMEGGTLCHSLRLLDGKPIYDAPSVDFIPFLYTPLYPIVVAALAKVVGLGYLVARLVSITAYALASWLGYRFARQEGGSRAAALAAVAIPAAAFVRTGTFYDLARADSLWMALSTAALLLVYRSARDATGRRRRDARRHLIAAAAALCFVAAFFTKQTTAPLMVAGALGLVLLDWRLTPTFGGTLAAVGLPLILLCDRVSHGWFWTYVYKLHQGHDFYAARAFRATPLQLLAIVGPALLLVPWALVRRRSAGLIYATWIGVAGMFAACLSFGTQWAFVNAYIPGVFLSSIAIGAAAGRLVKPITLHPAPRFRPAVVYACLGASLVLLRFDPRPLVPTAADRAAGRALIERLRAVDGEVLIPFHPFYAHLAGKRTYLHRMGVLDVTRAGLGTPRGLGEAIREHRFALAVFDNKVNWGWESWPGFLQEYQQTVPSIGPPVVSGASTRPEFAFVPRPADPPAAAPTAAPELAP